MTEQDRPQPRDYRDVLATRGYKRAIVERSYDEQALRRGEKVLEA